MTQQVDRIVLTADGAGIAPGEFQEFPLSLGLPEKAVGYLTFKTLQTYSNGEVVRWIGTPESESPAPRVSVEGKDAAVSDFAEMLPDPAPDEGNDGSGLAIGALIIAVVGTALAGVALVTRRRPAAT
jgi:uncharacterized protein